MKVLFIGGTGTISSACSQLALEQGIDLYHLNRGQSDRPTPKGVETLRGDIRDSASAKRALGDHNFDVVVEWIAYSPEHIAVDLEQFSGRTKQYIFISSASVYHVPTLNLPITESTPLHNPYWKYSQEKIACEQRLMQAYRQTGFPVTIVRPSHTYDERMAPMGFGYTVIDRMRRGKKVIVHGDGTSIWTLTNHKDFASGLLGLLGQPLAIGDSFHITNSEILTWNRIFKVIAEAAGVEADIIHIPSDFIAAFDAKWGASLLGDKAHSKIFDNSKIKSLVPAFNPVIPFQRGARQILAYYDADPAHRTVDEEQHERMDRIIEAYQAVWP